MYKFAAVSGEPATRTFRVESKVSALKREVAENGVFTRKMILCPVILMSKVVVVVSPFKILHNIQLKNVRKTTIDLTLNSS
jgi:hypothetical protein